MSNDLLPPDFTDEQKTTLANITPGHALVPRQGTAITDCPTSLDLSTRRGKSLALAAMSPSDLQFDKNGVARLLATEWIVFPDTGIDPQTGEVSEFARVVFIDKMGNTFRTTAAHGPKRLKAILELFSREDWENGLPILIMLKRSPKTERQYHDIRVELPEDE